MKNDLLNLAMEAFKNSIDMQIKFEIQEDDSLKTNALLKIQLQELKLTYYAEIKSVVNQSVIGFILNRKKDIPYQQLLITNFVNPIIADKLKANHINFIDTVGNIYIEHFPILIYIKGNKLKKQSFKPSANKAFNPSGLKMVYALLCNKELLNKPYREIANVSDIALGSIGMVMENLKHLGYILDMGKRGNKLVNKKSLFERWCLEYVEKLKPKLFLGTFEGTENFWKNTHIEHAKWGGEVAAEKLTKYLKPQTIMIYADEHELKNIIFQNRLNRTKHGNIDIFRKFWTNDIEEEKSIVHPFLIYADLLEINNQRVIETAKIIYEQDIVKYFR